MLKLQPQLSPKMNLRAVHDFVGILGFCKNPCPLAGVVKKKKTKTDKWRAH